MPMYNPPVLKQPYIVYSVYFIPRVHCTVYTVFYSALDCIKYQVGITHCTFNGVKFININSTPNTHLNTTKVPTKVMQCLIRMYIVNGNV